MSWRDDTDMGPPSKPRWMRVLAGMTDETDQKQAQLGESLVKAKGPGHGYCRSNRRRDCHHTASGCATFEVKHLLNVTAVRLKLEQNQLVGVSGEIGVLFDALKGA